MIICVDDCPEVQWVTLAEYWNGLNTSGGVLMPLPLVAGESIQVAAVFPLLLVGLGKGWMAGHYLPVPLQP